MTLSVPQTGSKLLAIATADSQSRVDGALALAKQAKDECQMTVMKCFKDVQTQIDAAQKARHDAEDRLKSTKEKHQAYVKQLKERIARLETDAKTYTTAINDYSSACATLANSNSFMSQTIAQINQQRIINSLLASRAYV